MAARWVDLLLRLNYTLDQADADLTDADRNIFYTHLLGTATRRREHRMPFPIEHPRPGPTTPGYRDPSGD